MCDALLMPVDIGEQTESIRAKGTRGLNCQKWWDLDSRAYFSLFLASAAVATALASLVASDMYEAAKVSTQVKSQTRHWPDFHIVHTFIVHNNKKICV